MSFAEVAQVAGFRAAWKVVCKLPESAAYAMFDRIAQGIIWWCSGTCGTSSR